jgi:single-strand DNA-binding protein
MNLNKVFILGNLTRDPEARSLPSGQAVASFGVATNRFWTDPQGQKQKKAEFHNIVAFGRLAEIVNQYLKKGSLVFVEGRIQTRTWQDQKSGEKRYRTEIVAESLQLGPRPAGRAETPEGRSPEQKEELETIDISEEEADPDKIPF